MFDLNADDGSVSRKEYKSPIPGGGQGDGAKAVPVAELDKPRMVRLHHHLMGTYTKELDKQYENRMQRALDDDFYDNHQWTEEDIATLEERGQKAIVYNVISASVDWVTGTEKRARADYKILPRRKEDSQPAQRKSELMKYLSDVNRTPFDISRAFEDSVKSGLGWIEDAINDEGDGEPLTAQYENWRNMLHDSSATKLDLTDGRYIFRSKWVDLDIACAMFKKRRGMLEQAAATTEDLLGTDEYGDEAMDSQETMLEYNSARAADRLSGYSRQRVRLIEGWIRLPLETQRIKGGVFHGELYDKFSPGHVEALNSGEAELVTKMTMRMHVAIFTTAGMLWFSESPYRHNQFPFTPIWGKRRAADGLPYGMIRGLRDIQEDINKRASKALAILSNNKVIMEEGAVEDVDALMEEVSRPDALIVTKPGKRLDLESDRDLSQYQLELMSRNIAMIQQASGVTDELLGRKTNATSGVAIQRRQDQGSMATAIYFDNLRLGSQVRGEKLLSNIEQFVSEKKAFRITNMRGNPQYVRVNDGLPENDIVRSKADYVITDADWRASLRQAAVDELLELMTRLPPQVSLLLLDLVVENMDISNRDELVKRIRSVTGQRDPDAEEPTEEELAQQQAKAELDQFQRAQLVAELRKTIATAAKSEAEAERIVAQLAVTKVDAQGRALATAGETLALPPAAAHIADHILAEAGFASASDQLAAAQATEQQAAAQPQQPMPTPQPPAPGPAPGLGAAPMP
ncbi:portal protein [Devosia yakushimensis]|uniref:Portal protein n=1 Tax=Devosia yakushimensis TaxID=470028 RepID=A0ABQ5UD11_9HYPH|nr:hypothetical protein [Devosia yakushimensis]GLQ09237.1 portal protein [Devosia yakushimensis]